MKHALVFALSISMSGCATQIQTGAPLPPDQVVRLSVRPPVLDQPEQLALAVISGGALNFGTWRVGLRRVDYKNVYGNEAVMPLGKHVAWVIAEQGPSGWWLLSILERPPSIWGCTSYIEFDVPAGTYGLSFNYDKGNPQFRIYDESSGNTFATAPCKGGATGIFRQTRPNAEQ
jgi:hypothetical protein